MTLSKKSILEKLDIQIAISINKLSIIAYLYMIIPCIIFFIGWLKTLIGITFSLILLFGLIYISRNIYTGNGSYFLSIKQLIIIIIVSLIWVYTSGVGGFYPQQSDWHWRNAVFRDLIDYSWPVEYPNSNNALVYYFNFFLVPACFGKLFGWSIANIALFLWTVIGVCISMLLIANLLKITETKKIVGMLIIFIVWMGLDDIRYRIVEILQLNTYGYQYTPNNALLQWVTNQTIVPWIAVPLFLNKKEIKLYAYLGLCVLASAPLPFIGIFILMVFDALYQVTKKYNYNIIEVIKDVFSVPNICGICSILIVYGLFFFRNTATNGSAGSGGFGLFIPIEVFTIKSLYNLILFWVFNFMIYSLLVYKENKKNDIYWIVNVSLLIFPLFRIGTSFDFGMRASIPALFILMIYFINQINVFFDEKVSVRFILMIACMSISALSIYKDWTHRFITKINTENRIDYYADNIVSFADKNLEDEINFLSSIDKPSIFFDKLAKTKTQKNAENDNKLYRTYLSSLGFEIEEGNYRISPFMDDSLFMTYKSDNAEDETFLVVLSDNFYEVNLDYVSSEGKYNIVFPDAEKSYLDVPQGTVYEDGKIWLWYGNGLFPQMFSIEEKSGYYMITWEDKYALAYDGNRVYIEELTGDENQLWIFNKD